MHVTHLLDFILHQEVIIFEKLFLIVIDVQGNVRIWDTVNETHILKIAARPISGRINDLAWDSESKRLIAVGDGKEKYS